ncbi:uncharacterized protein LOC116288376 [Actinia tenebrosa]|uniref:Uncharacterized protein LOC116288376 n=1 Tax=Actinia tenebrosa TaxID=6105 RepID=A0A6P8H6N2_ACTTE|nr:uncharacterized protein LOC116288376 [Actinia tenebrosa]XP_031551014.1 uncharacterized protein LOC116288376 [Actinia tenebrosa]XP_031551015.1 uncharacterized protein LOC116288376 [Actinia tenebrosa]XP_031551016.1 uncharacterized protein LOC116288376 [Actinia tenebrosa]XP_031551017.1 uncharacterized protein LOC116288376 [Actinia tenebrosa]
MMVYYAFQPFKQALALVFLFLSVFPLPGLLDSMVGHLQPFGSHWPPDVATQELDTVPHPREFWENFVKPRKAVVFRGAAKNSRAFHLWTEEYLISEYGNLTVRLEARAEENSKVPVGGQGILGRDTVEHFITNYQTMDAYVISQIPQPMEGDIAIPPCLRCGSFAESIQEVHLFLSAGGGKTKIHRDPYSTIHCVFNGTKDWLMIDRSQTDLLYMSEDSRFELGGYSYIDVDAVDLMKYPKIKDVRYSKVTMEAGDCIFVPGGLWHQVRSRGYMNTAVSIWFSRIYQFSDKGCDEAQIEFTFMNEVPVLWRFSGHGTLTQGHMDIYFIKWLLLTSSDKEGKINIKAFTDHYFVSNLEEESKKELMANDVTTRAKKFSEYIDPQNVGFITKEEVENFSIDKLKEIVLFFDPCDVSNTEDFEYSHIDAEQIMYLISQCKDSSGHFDSSKFIKSYVEELGGSPAKANKIVEDLDLNEVATIKEVERKAPQALKKYLNSHVHDPSFENKMIKQLMKHEEL